ncbi:MAG: DMT family transporter [Pseudomonadota bacterium]
MEGGTRLGILTMILTMLVFAAQDGISKYLAESYNVMTVVLFRYWFFALFVLLFCARKPGGLRRALRTRNLGLQISRGVLLALEICVMVYAFALLGLVEAHAAFAAYPLIIAALSGPVLGERVGWRRWSAIGVGFIGVLIILRPGLRVFSPEVLVAVLSAVMFALYGLLTRLAARHDSAETSFLYTGLVGGAVMTVIAPAFWQPMATQADWAWMAVLCVTGALGHYLLIQTYALAEASVVQPFAYFQLLFAGLIGIAVFGERPETATLIGAAVILAAGLYTLWRTRLRGGEKPPR